MIKIEHVETFGWEAAIRGMRNPMNSWEKSDSYPAVDCGKCGKIEREGTCKKEDRDCTGFECYEIGPKDLDLMKRLAKASTDHRKFMRMIVVYADIVAMQPWWSEFDTYKIATVRNSCSKMHRIHVKNFTEEDFEHRGIYECGGVTAKVFRTVIDHCNELREKFNETQEKKYWRALIELLPEGYMMRATVMLNYEVLANMYQSRKNHKLDEWHDFCDWIERLPYSELITGKERAMEFADEQGLKNAAAPAC